MGTAGSERRKRWRHKACRRLQARAAARNVAATLKQARRDPSDESLERLRGALLMIERAAAASPKLDAAAQNCARAYALALFQRGRAQEGTVVLRHRFPDARYRLADDVLRYGTAKPGATKFEKGSVGAFDDALPEALFRAVARALAPEGAFWPAHSYDDETSGFFSYVHSLDEEGVVVEAARRFRDSSPGPCRPSRKPQVSSGGRTGGRTARATSSTSTLRTRAPARMDPSILYVLSYFICRRLGWAGRRL